MVTLNSAIPGAKGGSNTILWIGLVIGAGLLAYNFWWLPKQEKEKAKQ